MKIKILFLSMIICSSLLHAQFSAVYVGAGGEYHIDSSQYLGTNFKTYRNNTQGYFSAKGTAQFLNPGDAQNINGYLKHIPSAANQVYSFPVGNGTDLRTLTVSGSRPEDAVIGTAWIAGDPTNIEDPTNENAKHNITSVTGPITSVSSVGQWDWVDLGTNQTEAGGVSVKVSIPDVTGFADQGDLRLVGWNGSSWIDLSGTATATGVSENSELSGTIPLGVVIQALAIGSVKLSTTTPVTLSSFTGKRSNGINVLSWITASEFNNKGFELQRSVNDQKTWSDIAFKAGNGTSAERHTYVYSDAEGAAYPSAYYRLIQYDLDGKSIQESKVVLIQGTSSDASVLYPNPATSSINLRLPADSQVKNGTARIISVAGVIIKVVSVSSQNPITIPVSELLKGNYFIQITSNGKMIYTGHFLKN